MIRFGSRYLQIASVVLAALGVLLLFPIESKATETREQTGTAFVAAADGWLLTCAHVVANAQSIGVRLGEKTYAAKSIFIDQQTDLALLRIEANGLTPLPLGDSKKVELGQEVRAFGFPLLDVLGDDLKVTRGTLAGVDMRGLQIDAAINPGNSGGPLVNTRGEVVGINSRKSRVANMGFAVPIHHALALLRAEKVSFRMGGSEEVLDGPALVRRVRPSVALVRVKLKANAPRENSNPESSSFVRTLSGHTGEICAVAFSPDGKLLATGSRDKTVKLWKPDSGELVRTFSNHTAVVWAVAFAQDGKTVASGSADNTVKLWNAETGAEQGTLAEHTSQVVSVAWSRDGKLLASASWDKSVILWNAATARRVRVLQGRGSDMWSVAFSPDGKTLAAASGDSFVEANEVYLWDVATGALQRTLTGHAAPVHGVTFSADGKRLATASHDKTVRIWDATNGKVLSTLEGHRGPVDTVAFSPDGRFLASGGLDWLALLWRADNGSLEHACQGHRQQIRSVAFSPDGHLLASGSADGTIKLWRISK